MIVESFTFDHTKVKAPFVRNCGRVVTPNGDIIMKFDLRFTQPNQDIMPTGAVHALEHLLAGFIREEVDDVIDLSPMGCRTGFYLIKVGESNEEEIKEALFASLQKVLEAEEVPAANEIQCGNYRDMSLADAKKYASKVLKGLK
ncbi:MAG: S-ribosylhomocysteine lyase [Firmicutes bacterium]|nr:S-ribosylhomocysteine lyase [Bacillota bacterium]